jgi:hypothetical protein
MERKMEKDIVRDVLIFCIINVLLLQEFSG